MAEVRRPSVQPAIPFIDNVTVPLTNSGGIWLAIVTPLSILRVIIGIIGVWLYTILLTLLKRAECDPQQPPFRSYPFVISATRFTSKFMLNCLGFTVNIRGAELLEDEFYRGRAPIVVCNHVSYLDIFPASAVLGPFFSLARADVARWVRVHTRLQGYL